MTELRVFISSTFRDLQEEREHLVKKIFPEIRSLCRARGITFTEVDLRWGLTDEQLALGQVIRTCLEEVDKCRPYFIGITGDRYGFVPSYLDVQKDPLLLELYPWIEDATIEGMSITEMEAHYAVLGMTEGRGGKEAMEHARFYFRRQRETLDQDDQQSDESARLEAYQQRIRQSGATVEQYRDAVSLGELIYDDILKIIKRDFADAKPPTPLEEERARHDAFSLSRRRAYIANPAYLKKLNDHANGDGPPLVIYAESGSGKSSLFAFWAEQFRRRNPDAHIIEHYVGIGATATDHYAVIRHVCMEINERFGREDEIPSDPEKLENALGQWLGYAEHDLRKAKAVRGTPKAESEEEQTDAPASDSSFIPHPSSLILILDGLNQLQGEALKLRWIPDVISPSIRLIISSTVEGTLVELQKRGWSRFGMQALSEAERETIVVRYLAECHKSLNPDQIKRLATDYKCGHPLFLKTVLEELRLLGHHEELDAKIASYLEATGTEDLFQRVLERLEEDYNMRAVRDVMSLLSASRSGLDERELSDISGLARLKIATMIAGLDYHLVRKEGRLTFFHDYLRRAVEKRYLPDEGKRRATHMKIADHFDTNVTAAIASGRDVSVRMASELAYQLHVAGARDRLGECLSTMPVFLALYAGETLCEVLRYWSSMDEGTDVAGMYRRGLAEWSLEPGAERSRGVGQVADLLECLGHWSAAIDLGRERLAGAIERGDRSEEAESRVGMGWLLTLRGEDVESLAESTRALELFTDLGDRRGVARAIGNMGVLYSRRGEDTLAMECYERSLNIAEELGNRSGVARAIGNMGVVYSSRGEDERAMECYERSLSIAEELGDSAGVGGAIGNMGLVYSSRGEDERALECFERWLSIAAELGDRLGVAGAIGNMGVVYSNRGEDERAIECYERQLSIAEELGDRNGVARGIGNMGVVYSRRGEYERAMECLEGWLSIAEELGDRRGVAVAIGNMGGVYHYRGEGERALEHFSRAVGELQAIGARSNLSDCLFGIADVLLALVEGNAVMPGYLPRYLPGEANEADPNVETWRMISLQRARECVEEGVAISEELSKPDTLFSGRVLLASITAAEGNADAAIATLRGMLDRANYDDQRAGLHYRLWKLTGTDSDHCGEALRLYRSLVEKAPKHEYRKRIAELEHTPNSSL